MPQEVTNEELARMINKGFAGTATKEDMAQVKTDVAQLKSDMVEVKTGMTEVNKRLDTVESKLDRALYREIDKHERWIKLLADKVGVQLSH